MNLGIIKRRFCSSDMVMSVYDWVGSKSLLPVQFKLSNYQGQVFMPEQSVVDIDNLTLNMVPCEATPGLEDDEISFMGFGLPGEDNNDTILALDLSHNSDISESYQTSPDVLEIQSLFPPQVNNSV